ncbi:TolC family protein [Uliginosibacterium sp. H3]|uniref:TolC family protein n=1 Tax=Uliginosibacterium silvisoli TaxID=3114758 RepID=A0ABU6K227_9RHOO|nr:TolC family protein [Uliginosibacterium sp. H3]
MRLFQRNVLACLLGTAAVSVCLRPAFAEHPTDRLVVANVPLDLSLKPSAVSPSVVRGAALTEREAMQRALAHSPWLRAAGREVEAANGAVDQGGARPNPELSYEMEDTRKASRTNTVILSQPLELGGKRAARISAAERGRDVASAQLSVRRAELRAQVQAGFREILAAQESLHQGDESLALAQRATQAAARRVQAGSASPQEATRARLEESGARLARAQAEAALGAARDRLAALWGIAQADFTRVEGRFDELPLVPTREALLSRLDNAPALAVANNEATRRQALTQVEQSRRYPDLNVSVGVKRDAEVGRNQAVLGVSIPLPLFDSNRGNLREALARREQALDELAVTRASVSAELMQARDRLLLSRLEADSLTNESLPGAQSALDAATRGYELGKFGFLDVLDAQRSLFQLKTQRLRAWIEAHKAAGDIARLLGDETDAETITNTSSIAGQTPDRKP